MQIAGVNKLLSALMGPSAADSDLSDYTTTPPLIRISDVSVFYVILNPVGIDFNVIPRHCFGASG